MLRGDAPPAGWYPDPEGGPRLRWWHGTDWSHRYRPPASRSEIERTIAARQSANPSIADAVRSGQETRRIPRSEVDEIVAQVRQVARGELDRAAEQFTQRALTAGRELQPLVTEYTNRLIRWLRIAIVVVVLAVIAWFLFQAIANITFLEWLGERIDRLTD